MEEIWKDIQKYEGLYQVSDLGRIKRIAPEANTYVGKIIKPIKINGYVFVNLYSQGKRRCHKIHKIVAESFLGSRPLGKQINHKNGNKEDNNLNNLEWVTPKENTFHSWNILGKAQRGEDGGNHKLFEFEVKEIKDLLKTKILRIKDIASNYNVSESTIYFIKTNHIWSHV